MSHLPPGYQGAALFGRRDPGIDPMSPLFLGGWERVVSTRGYQSS
jgi:hypothetical protein